MGSKCSQCVPGSLVPHYPPQPVSLSEMGTAPKKTSRTIQHGQNGSRMFLGWGDPTEPQPCQKHTLTQASQDNRTKGSRGDPARLSLGGNPAFCSSSQRAFPDPRCLCCQPAPQSRTSPRAPTSQCCPTGGNPAQSLPAPQGLKRNFSGFVPRLFKSI
ncbi:gametocyte-specific factor 2 isoform X3 [Gallus gallus]|uniref:gametocyte-specific factor 2 isoform X3 n=1 Tax=Gallus gallus TaxID=9031 RepID=UPI000739F035|nr:gametocyte-specific factor 2 isoform X3 [Gallus gallus]|eukprot:XP_015129014.1 gametocyte-specific factor 1 isoform X6 [Gallus gallus]